MEIAIKVKKKIGELIEVGDIENAKKLLDEYYKIGKNDFEYYSFSGIIKIIENYFESAISDFKIGLLFNDYSYDLNYNIAFAYEAIRDYKKAYWYYNKIKNFYDNNKLNKEIHEKLKSLNDYYDISLNYETKVLLIIGKTIRYELKNKIIEMENKNRCITILKEDYEYFNVGIKWSDIVLIEWNNDFIKIENIKENIMKLVNDGLINEAKVMSEEYMNIIKYDVETFCFMGNIYLKEEDFNGAEKLYKEGLEIYPFNYDIMIKLAYLYEVQKKYFESLIVYKKILREHYYQIDRTEIENKVRDIKNNIIALNTGSFEANVANLDKILFIDFDNNQKVNLLANRLSEYGIDIDIAYSGNTPINNTVNNRIPYRKILGIQNINDLIEYAKYYNYEVIHVFSASKELKKYFKQSGLITLDFNGFFKQDEELISRYSQHKIKQKNVTMLNKIDDFTIVIPTYNRPYYLNRVLTFINNYRKLNPNVLILDSSEKNNKLRNKLIIDKFNNSKIIYEKFSPSINFYEKLNFGLENVYTTYVTLCADDDFLTEEGLLESFKILEKNKDLYSVKGKNLYYVNSMANLIEYDWFQGLSDKKSIDRLEKIVQGFVPSLIYQMFRTDKYKKMNSFIKDNVKNFPQNATFLEYLFYFIVIATGRIEKINVDLNIRDKGVSREEEIENFPHAIIDGTFNENYDKYRLFLKKYFVEIGESIENIDEKLGNIFIDFLVNFLNVPKENIILINNEFDLKELEIGMRTSWVWRYDF